MRIAWLTDIHLNFLGLQARINFYHVVNTASPDALLITGDIAEAPSLTHLLTEMFTYVKKPIYFVLGNHDYYYSHVEGVRHEIMCLTAQEKKLCWLATAGAVLLNEETCLVGQDSWADDRYSNYEATRVMLNDRIMIDDLSREKEKGKQALFDKMRQLADRDANQLNEDLSKAISMSMVKKIIVLLHVPPFKEVCLPEKKFSDESYLSYFTSKVMGEVVMDKATTFTHIDFLVLCGHTHHEAHYQPLRNLTVRVGGVRDQQPVIQDIIVI